MTLHPLAGQTAPPDLLIDPAQLQREYYDRVPDLDDPTQRVAFGTSGHRGSPQSGSFNEAHILATTRRSAITAGRKASTARCSWARTRTRCRGRRR
jgi:phosphoglucomutase